MKIIDIETPVCNVPAHRTHKFIIGHQLITVMGALWLGLMVRVCNGADNHIDLPPSHSVRPERFVTGFEFAEGPTFDHEGNLYAANYQRLGTIGKVTPAGKANVWCDLVKQSPVEGKRPQANGLKVDAQGNVLAADSGAGRLLRIAGDGSRIEVLADRWKDLPFRSLNDLALDVSGNIYFTDPGDSSAEKPDGSIYRYDATTKEISRLDTGLAYPNGIGVTPDQRHLCVAESSRYRLLIFDLAEDGMVSNRRILIDFSKKTIGQIVGGDFFPDGFVFDSEGRLYVAMWTGGVINVVEVPSGNLLRQYNAGGGQATNCHFHGTYLFTTVAADKSVYRLNLGVEGFRYRKVPGGEK